MAYVYVYSYVYVYYYIFIYVFIFSKSRVGGDTPQPPARFFIQFLHLI